MLPEVGFLETAESAGESVLLLLSMGFVAGVNKCLDRPHEARGT